MPATVVASLHQNFFNFVIQAVMSQRPSLCNFETQMFVDDPSLMCEPINVPILMPAQPLLTLQPPLPLPGAPHFGMEFCLQISELEIDLHPADPGPLPAPELGVLGEQRGRLHMKACAAIPCTYDWIIEMAADVQASLYPPINPKDLIDGKPPQPPAPPWWDGTATLWADPENIHCFCLDVYADVGIQRKASAAGDTLQFVVHEIEIVDLKPEGLENSLECLIETVLKVALLPRMRLLVTNLVFQIGAFSFTVGLTPTSGTLPFNPDIANDRLTLSVDII